MKYDARACHFNMDTGCVELLLRDGRMISIDCTGVEDALDVTMAAWLCRLDSERRTRGVSEECGGKSRIRRLSIKGYAAINRIPFYTLSLPDRCGIGT